MGDASQDASIDDEASIENDASIQLFADSALSDVAEVKEAGAPASGDIVVNPSVLHQTIDGFGAADVYTPGGALTPAEGQLFFDPVNGIGLSILRIGINGDGQPLGSGTLSDVQLAASYGAIVWAAPWSPAAGDKDNNSQNNGGHLCADAGQGTCTGNDYTAWASALASYASSVYTATEMVNFVKVLGPMLAALSPPVKLIAPETESWAHLWAGPADCSGTSNYGPCIHGDTQAESAIAVYATHDYGFAEATPPAWLAKPLWETEVSGLSGSAQGGPSTDITNGIAVARWIYNALVTGGASAWHYWWLVGQASNNDNEGLIFMPGDGPGGVGDVSSPPKRLYTVGNFSRFVRPGYQRLDVSGPVPSGVQVAAFRNPADNTMAIVAINGNAAASPVTLFVAGTAWPGAVTPWVTSASANLAATTAVPLSGARFAVTLAPQSVTTFVGKP
jgi:glucuronoarabinoxylan endo-1,4-beta-xylanase